MPVKRWLKILFILMAGSFLLAFSNYPPGDQLQRIRAFSRAQEFDYVGWTLNALGTKLGQAALDATETLTPEAQRQIVLDYLDLVARIDQVEGHLNNIYADPEVENPEMASRLVREQLSELGAQRERLGPTAESILQTQISETVAGLGLTAPAGSLSQHSFTDCVNCLAA